MRRAELDCDLVQIQEGFMGVHTYGNLSLLSAEQWVACAQLRLSMDMRRHEVQMSKEGIGDRHWPPLAYVSEPIFEEFTQVSKTGYADVAVSVAELLLLAKADVNATVKSARDRGESAVILGFRAPSVAATATARWSTAWRRSGAATSAPAP